MDLALSLGIWFLQFWTSLDLAASTGDWTCMKPSWERESLLRETVAGSYLPCAGPAQLLALEADLALTILTNWTCSRAFLLELMAVTTPRDLWHTLAGPLVFYGEEGEKQDSSWEESKCKNTTQCGWTLSLGNAPDSFATLRSWSHKDARIYLHHLAKPWIACL